MSLSCVLVTLTLSDPSAAASAQLSFTPSLASKSSSSESTIASSSSKSPEVPTSTSPPSTPAQHAQTTSTSTIISTVYTGTTLTSSTSTPAAKQPITTEITSTTTLWGANGQPFTTQTTTFASVSTPARRALRNRATDSVSTLVTQICSDTAATSSSGASGVNASTTAQADNSSVPKRTNHAGAIAGGIVGALVLAVLVGFLALWCRRRRRRDPYATLERPDPFFLSRGREAPLAYGQSIPLTKRLPGAPEHDPLTRATAGSALEMNHIYSDSSNFHGGLHEKAIAPTAESAVVSSSNSEEEGSRAPRRGSVFYLQQMELMRMEIASLAARGRPERPPPDYSD